MTSLRLPRLPDRSPVKITISLTPDLDQALRDYALLYEQTYGRTEPPQELVPAILSSFFESDRHFCRFRRGSERE